MANNIEEKIEEFVTPIIEKLGYSVFDVLFVKEGKDYFLRIFIDKSGGISLNDCETVNNAITDLLDEKEFIKVMYFLEVSSSGVERVIRKDRHLEQFKNTEIEISLYKQIDNKKEYIGILENFNKEYIDIKIEGQTIRIERKNISNIKTVYNWN